MMPKVERLSESTIQYTQTLYDDESTREKHTMMNKSDVISDDERNNVDDDFDWESFFKWGSTFRITIERLD
jgi:hypothetical protein